MAFLVVGLFVGVVAGLLTAPVFWWTGYGFVPYGYLHTVGSGVERSFLVVGHVVVRATCFVFAGGLAMLAD